VPRKQRSNPKTKHKAVELRKETTPAERKLWSRIRNDQLGVTFRRQHAVGNYIPDFYSPKAKLIIELDGSQHLEQEEYDEERTKYLGSQGCKVIRFWNNHVMNNIEGVYSPYFMRWNMKPVKIELCIGFPYLVMPLS